MSGRKGAVEEHTHEEWGDWRIMAASKVPKRNDHVPAAARINLPSCVCPSHPTPSAPDMVFSTPSAPDTAFPHLADLVQRQDDLARLLLVRAARLDLLLVGALACASRHAAADAPRSRRCVYGVKAALDGRMFHDWEKCLLNA
eukprot:219021-Chlamydomonas_euryale.AAC.6